MEDNTRARVDALMRRLLDVERERKEILRAIELAELADAHVERLEIPGAYGDAASLAAFPKSRLITIVEQHWRVHHMGMPEAFLSMSKAELVNYVVDVKGLRGVYRPGDRPSKKAKAASGNEKGKHRHASRYAF